MLSDNVQHMTVNPETDKRTKRAVKRVAYPTPPQKIFDKYPIDAKTKAYAAQMNKRAYTWSHTASNRTKPNQPFLSVDQKKR